MTKRIICLCLSACLTVCLTACGDNVEKSETSSVSLERSTMIPKLVETESDTEAYVPVSAETEQSAEPVEAKSNDEYEYEVFADHIRLTKYLQREGEVEIPAEIDGLPVTVVGERAFAFTYTGVASVVIPEGITEIEKDAFGYSALSRVELPDSLIKIGDMAFHGCDNLEIVSIPKNVSEIGNNVFDGCDSLTNVDFADGVTEIGEFMFNVCKSLEEVTIPDTVKTIGDYAFSNCTGLEKIIIPESVAELGFGTFYCCKNLSNVTLSKSFDEFAVERAFYSTPWYEANFETDTEE